MRIKRWLNLKDECHIWVMCVINEFSLGGWFRPQFGRLLHELLTGEIVFCGSMPVGERMFMDDPAKTTNTWVRV